ncbi:MAG: Flp pilus assembly protein CpaB [Chloroflexi bacterium]|nr:Flp pilus assembly protein CpaB [Chloroflexota bacterium]
MAQRAASSAQGRLNRRFLLVAILLAGLSAALVYARIAATDDGSSGGGSPSGGDQRVVVARSAIQERTIITKDMLELKNFSASSVTTGAFTTIEDAVGKVTKFPIEVNQQVVASAVVSTTGSVSNAQISLVVPTGKRAVSIRASQVQTAGGLILPGDWVDVVWTCCKDSSVVSKTLLKNVQVAAVAQSIVSSGPVSDATPGAESKNPVAADQGDPLPDAATITLLLSPEEIQQVILAEGMGQLRATSRGIGDTATPDSGVTLLTDPTLLPESDVARLPEALKPDGYKREQ